MEFNIASVDDFDFDIAVYLDQQIGDMAGLLGMDKSGGELCVFFRNNQQCRRGPRCPFRHTYLEKKTVCKHWLRGLCKKGDKCDFLHKYDMSKMAECQFYTQSKMCTNEDCLYRHIDPESKMKPCPWFERGMCKKGHECRDRHVKKVACPNYMDGFCPLGPECGMTHPKWDMSKID